VFFAAVGFLYFSGSEVAAQATYNFTKIADTNFFLLGFSAPSVNESGRVAFQARARGGNFNAIYTGDGTETALNDYTLIVSNGPSFSFGPPGSYVGSQVAFGAELNQNGTGGIFSSDGFGLHTIVIDPTIGAPGFRVARVNRAGQFAYLGGQHPGDLGVYVGQNGSRTPIYTIPASFTRGPTPEMHNLLDPPLSMAINNAGAIFFEADFFNLPDNPSQDIDFGGLVQGNTGGTLPTLLVTDGTLPNDDFQSLEEYAANDSGQIACIVSVSGDAGFHYVLFSGAGGVNSVLVDTLSGPFTDLEPPSGLNSVAINNSGTIVFPAHFKDGSGQSQYGLFTGPDPVKDKIIATGDTLFGSKVFDVNFDRVGFNDRGQVAIQVALQGGDVIVRADPVSGGADVDWVAPGSGSFNDVANWQPKNGDPPRVPVKTSTFSDNAVFSEPTKYTVEAGTQTTERLMVLNGDVTLADLDYTASALDPLLPSVFVDGGTLTITNGTLHSSHGRIGFSSPSSQMNVNAAQWSSQGRIEVGGNAFGQLSLAFGGLVNCAESRIGNGFGGGQAVIKAGSVWNTANLAVGYSGHGELHVEGGGRVVSDSAVVGLGPGFASTVEISGVSSGGVPAEWDINNPTTGLNVGSSGAGTLEITDGGTNSVLEGVNIGANMLGMGVIKVSGVHAGGNRSSLHTPNLILIGKGGLTIQDGGLADAAALLTQAGTVTVTGVNAATSMRSTLDLQGDPLLPSLTMGISGGGGALVIDQGALVHSLSASIGADPANAACKVDILGLGGTPVSTLHVDQDMDVGKSSPSTITLSNGRLEVGGTLTVFGDGVIQGNGTLVAGNRLNNGGYISPGLSPGQLIINGDYVQMPGGRLKIEVGGLNPGVSHDQLVVNGNATLDGTLELRFINGFAPKQGDTFDFLRAGNSPSNGFAAVELKNLADGFQFDIATNNSTNITLEALNDGVFVTPLQGEISSSNVVTIGGISYLPYTLQVTNDCSIVDLSGSLTRQGQNLFQTLTERNDPQCRGSSANVSRVLPLGVLPPGSYQFHFMSDGVNVYTTSFTVPTGTGKTLDVTRVHGGDLNLQINGIDSILYTIQASSDLQNWFDVPAHAGTFLGPYSIQESPSVQPAQFYRVKLQ